MIHENLYFINKNRIRPNQFLLFTVYAIVMLLKHFRMLYYNQNQGTKNYRQFKFQITLFHIYQEDNISIKHSFFEDLLFFPNIVAIFN
jgi:hypothetical protein